MAARWEKPCVCFGRGRGRKTFTVRGYLWFPSSILYRVTQNDAACLDTSAHRLFCQVLISSLLSSMTLTNAVSNMGNSSGSQCKAVLYHQWERAGALLSPAALRPTLYFQLSLPGCIPRSPFLPTQCTSLHTNWMLSLCCQQALSVHKSALMSYDRSFQL